MTDLSAISLSSPRLRLRSVTVADAPEVFAAVTPTLTRFMAFEPSPSVEAVADVFRAWLPKLLSGVELHMVIRLATSGEFLGVVGVHHLGSPEPELGVWIKEPAHGCGYGREAVATLAKWASAIPDTTGFIYPVAEQNQPSRRLAEALHGTVVGDRPLKKPSGIEHRLLVYRIPAKV